LNEIKNKDKSADFRIASAEEDFNAKVIRQCYVNEVNVDIPVPLVVRLAVQVGGREANEEESRN